MCVVYLRVHASVIHSMHLDKCIVYVFTISIIQSSPSALKIAYALFILLLYFMNRKTIHKSFCWVISNLLLHFYFVINFSNVHCLARIFLRNLIALLGSKYMIT